MLRTIVHLVCTMIAAKPRATRIPIAATGRPRYAQSGQVSGRTYRRHRAIEFRKFLDLIEAAVPPDRDVHLILDNYSTHKTPLIHRQAPTLPSAFHADLFFGTWWNAGSRNWTKQLRRGTHRSVRRLEAAIWEFLDTSNAAGKPFVWTKSADEILGPATGRRLVVGVVSSVTSCRRRRFASRGVHRRR